MTPRHAWRAVREAYERFVPVPVRRIIGFDTKGIVSLALWAAQRRHGVPPGATAVPYAGAQTTTMALWLFAMTVELVGVDIVLRATGAPAGLRNLILLLDAYGLLIGLAVMAACVTRPHVISATEVRIRYGAFFDLRVPRELIASVRPVRNYNETGMVKVADERLAVAVSAQTNLIIELTEPITAIRPLGKRTQARTIRFFADNPTAVTEALQAHRKPALDP